MVKPSRPKRLSDRPLPVGPQIASHAGTVLTRHSCSISKASLWPPTDEKSAALDCRSALLCMPTKGRHVAFGVALKDQFASNHGIPAICKRSVETLRHAGLEEHQLFDNPAGSADSRKVNLLKAAWDRGQDPLKVCADHVAVAKAFLLWLQCLPSSLLPESTWQNLLDVPKCSSTGHQLQTLKSALQKVDTCELQILSILLDFLNSHCSAAHVAPQRLGQIFAPPLLHVPEASDPQEPSSPLQQAAPSVISLMISHVHVLFAPGALQLSSPQSEHQKTPPVPEAHLLPASPPSIPIPPKPVPTRPVQGSPCPSAEDAAAAASDAVRQGAPADVVAAAPLGLTKRPLRIRCPRSTANGGKELPRSLPALPRSPAEGSVPAASCAAEAGKPFEVAAHEVYNCECGQPAALASVVDAMVADTLQRVLFCV